MTSPPHLPRVPGGRSAVYLGRTLDKHQTSVHVAPVQHVRGWGGPQDPNDAKAWPSLPLLDALTKVWPTDAHARGYRTTDGLGGWLGHLPSIKKAAIPGMLKRKACPKMLTVWMDLDTKYHEPWKSPKKAAKTVQRVAALIAASPLRGAGVYSTRAGLRLVWVL